MTCERCGITLEVGMYPFCRGDAADHGRGTYTAIGDEMDHWQVNGTRTPIHFTSKAERRAWLKANGYHEAVYHQPLPGTDKSAHTVNWCSRMDPQTAENVRILIERAFTCGTTHAAQDEAAIHFTPDIHDMTEEEAARYVR